MSTAGARSGAAPRALNSRSAKAEHFRSLDTEIRNTYPYVHVREMRWTFRQCRRLVDGALSDTDLLGVTITWVVHVDLARLIPPGPLDATGFSLLRNQAARIVLLAFPEYAHPLVRTIRATVPDAPTDDVELLGLVHHVWMLRIFLPSIRHDQSPSAPLDDRGRRRWLSHAWLAILAASQGTIELDPKAIRATAMAAFDSRKKTRNIDGSWTKKWAYPSEVHASSKFASALLETFASQYEDIEYLAIKRGGRRLIVNFRGVRDKIGKALGLVRTRRVDALDRSTPDLEPEDIGPAINAANQAIDARATLDALRNLQDFDTSTPEGQLVDEIARRLLADPELAEHIFEDDGLASILRAYLTECASINDPALKAAVAHHLLGPEYSREQLGALFSCTARKVQLRAAAAEPLAKKIRVSIG